MPPRIGPPHPARRRHDQRTARASPRRCSCRTLPNCANTRWVGRSWRPRSRAVARAGDAVMDMAYLHCPRHRPRRSMFETRVAGADVVVVIAGCGTASPSVISPRCPTPSWSIAPPRSRHFHPGRRARRRRARSGGDVPRYGARARRDAFRARLADSGVATRRSPPPATYKPGCCRRCTSAAVGVSPTAN